jgi:hypothetical protein
MYRSIDERSVTYRGVFASFAVVAVAVLVATHAGDAKAVDASTTKHPDARQAPGNWNFEKGDFTGWQVSARGSGAWHVYSDGTRPPDPADSDPNVPFNVPAPPEGRFAAVTDMSAPGTRILYRDVKLDGRLRLRFTLFYDNAVGRFTSTAILDHELRKANQQVRVDLVDPAAPVDSVASKDVLATIFRTAPGDPGKLAPHAVTFDLSRWAGKKVRLRFAQVDNRGPLRAGVDDVRVQPIGS